MLADKSSVVFNATTHGDENMSHAISASCCGTTIRHRLYCSSQFPVSLQGGDIIAQP